LEVHDGHNYDRKKTISPIQAYWEWRNSKSGNSNTGSNPTAGSTGTSSGSSGAGNLSSTSQITNPGANPVNQESSGQTNSFTVLGIPNNFALGSRNIEYMSGPDFTSGDSPILKELKIEGFIEATFRRLVETGTIAVKGNPSVPKPFYEYFMSGQGGERLEGYFSPLSQEAKIDYGFKPTFETIRDQVTNKINDLVGQQAKSLYVNGDTLKDQMYDVWSNSLPHTEFNSGNLFVVVHGTQKSEVNLNIFYLQTAEIISPTLAKVEWSGRFSYSLFDDFGFSLYEDAIKPVREIEYLIETARNALMSKKFISAFAQAKEIVKKIGALSVTGIG